MKLNDYGTAGYLRIKKMHLIGSGEGLTWDRTDIVEYNFHSLPRLYKRLKTLKDMEISTMSLFVKYRDTEIRAAAKNFNNIDHLIELSEPRTPFGLYRSSQIGDRYLVLAQDIGTSLRNFVDSSIARYKKDLKGYYSYNPTKRFDMDFKFVSIPKRDKALRKRYMKNIPKQRLVERALLEEGLHGT